METLVTKTIPTKELKEYKNYINHLFKNEDGVYNICKTEEDIIKSNQWFKNLPLISFIISDKPIEIDDKFLAVATNIELNGKIFTYLGESTKGEGVILLLNSVNEIVYSTKSLMTHSKRFERMATLEDMEKLVAGQSTLIELYNRMF